MAVHQFNQTRSENLYRSSKSSSDFRISMYTAHAAVLKRFVLSSQLLTARQRVRLMMMEGSV